MIPRHPFAHFGYQLNHILSYRRHHDSAMHAVVNRPTQDCQSRYLLSTKQRHSQLAADVILKNAPKHLANNVVTV